MGAIRRFVDSNVFIYLMLKDPDYSSTALNILLRFEEGVEIGYTSTFVLSQVLAHLIRRGRIEAVEKLYDYLEGALIVVVETLRDDFDNARKLKRGLGLPWELWDDLVIASQMIRYNIREIYSNDSDFDLIKDIKRIFK